AVIVLAPADHGAVRDHAPVAGAADDLRRTGDAEDLDRREPIGRAVVADLARVVRAPAPQRAVGADRARVRFAGADRGSARRPLVGIRETEPADARVVVGAWP